MQTRNTKITPAASIENGGDVPTSLVSNLTALFMHTPHHPNLPLNHSVTPFKLSISPPANLFPKLTATKLQYKIHLCVQPSAHVPFNTYHTNLVLLFFRSILYSFSYASLLTSIMRFSLVLTFVLSIFSDYFFNIFFLTIYFLW